MKEFMVGLLFLLAVAILAVVGWLLRPLLILLVFFLRVIVIGALVIFAIWLLGRFIIFVWENLKKRSTKSRN